MPAVSNPLHYTGPLQGGSKCKPPIFHLILTTVVHNWPPFQPWASKRIFEFKSVQFTDALKFPIYTVSKKKTTLIFDITSPSVLNDDELMSKSGFFFFSDTVYILFLPNNTSAVMPFKIKNEVKQNKIK